ncbi:hypothetical protein C8J57DRAFT_1498391 [Mycena rebaudengoi]|nr:hypothetical protein C8J57DRAFT_1498391 [Mycena rebaudengoi]
MPTSSARLQSQLTNEIGKQTCESSTATRHAIYAKIRDGFGTPQLGFAFETVSQAGVVYTNALFIPGDAVTHHALLGGAPASGSSPATPDVRSLWGYVFADRGTSLETCTSAAELTGYARPSSCLLGSPRRSRSAGMLCDVPSTISGRLLLSPFGLLSSMCTRSPPRRLTTGAISCKATSEWTPYTIYYMTRLRTCSLLLEMRTMLCAWFRKLDMLREDWGRAWKIAERGDEVSKRLLFHQFASRGVEDYMDVFIEYREENE